MLEPQHREALLSMAATCFQASREATGGVRSSSKAWTQKTVVEPCAA